MYFKEDIIPYSITSVLLLIFKICYIGLLSLFFRVLKTVLKENRLS